MPLSTPPLRPLAHSLAHSLARRVPAAALGGILMISATGCSRDAHPEPASASPSATTFTKISPSVLGDADPDEGAWTAVDSTSDYTPAPCGTTLESTTGARPATTATWRNHAAVVQAQQHTYPTSRRAAAAAAALKDAIDACPTWIYQGASAQARPVPGTAHSASTATHVSVFTPTGRVETAWLVSVDGATVTSVVVSEPSVEYSDRVDTMARSLAETL